MIRWSMFMILTVVSVYCLAATNADEKEKPAEKPATKTEKAESKNSENAKPESAEKKTAAKKDKEKSDAADKDGDKKEDAEDKFTAKCPVSGEAATKEQFTAYKEKQVYFCCDKCKAAFEAEPAKYEVKANHQLAQTKQFVQKKCPMTGGPLDKEQSARVSNVTVRFCCEKCKGSVQNATADEKLEMIFAEKPFKKAYVAAKVESKDGDSKDGESKEKPKAEKLKKVSEKKKDEPKEKPAEKSDAK